MDGHTQPIRFGSLIGAVTILFGSDVDLLIILDIFDYFAFDIILVIVRWYAGRTIAVGLAVRFVHVSIIVEAVKRIGDLLLVDLVFDQRLEDFRLWRWGMLFDDVLTTASSVDRC